MQHLDQQVVDSTLVFFTNELDRQDPALNEPLSTYTWQRDIAIAPLSLGDMSTSFRSSLYTAVGGVQPGGKSFIGAKATEIGTVGVDFERKTSPTFLWGEAVQATVVEIERAQLLGMSLDAELVKALNEKLNLDKQNQAYLGDAPSGVYGMLNNPSVTAGAALTGGWATATDDQIIADISDVLGAAHAASGYKYMPRDLLLPPVQFNLLMTRRISGTSESLGNYIARSSLSNAYNGVPLNIYSVRELVGIGAEGSDRMVAYTNNSSLIRLPMSPVMRQPVQFVGVFHRTIYLANFGTVEIPKVETVRYADGI
jgi:hypothetical protein